MPWTAEVFDQRPVVADPQVFCMSSVPTASDPREASCTCMTEQGTRYDLPQPMCRTLARNGAPYNPRTRTCASSSNNSRRRPGRWVIRISLCSSQDLSLQRAHVTSAHSPSRSLTLLLLAFLRPHGPVSSAWFVTTRRCRSAAQLLGHCIPTDQQGGLQSRL